MGCAKNNLVPVESLLSVEPDATGRCRDQRETIRKSLRVRANRLYMIGELALAAQLLLDSDALQYPVRVSI
jgi:hypothetical protein